MISRRCESTSYYQNHAYTVIIPNKGNRSKKLGKVKIITSWLFPPMATCATLCINTNNESIKNNEHVS